MKIIFIFLLTCFSSLGAETMLSLKSGQTQMFSYGLYHIVSDTENPSSSPTELDLVLVMRNYNAKWLNLQGISKTNFSVLDAKGQELKFYLRESPSSGIANDESALFHLIVRSQNAPTPWTLRLHAKPDDFTPIELTIPSIVPRDK